MEGFNSMMRIATQNRWIKGSQIGDRTRNRKKISHLLYADDTTILSDPEAKQLNYIRLILILFEAVSGLRVNWGKSSLIAVKEVPQIQGFASILGCKVEKLLTTYIGMPSLGIWDGIMEKAEKIIKMEGSVSILGG